MMQSQPQNFENHSRFVPSYHIVAFGILGIFLIWSLVRLIQNFSVDSGIFFLLAISQLILFFCMRIFALKAQDRVIRLEERLRMERLLAADMQSCIQEFSPDQLIALRFASDSELPELARKVRLEQITDRKAIKKLIREWKADHFRV